MTNTHRIAVIPGDGIGTEVVPEGLRVLDAAAAAFDQYVNLRPVRSTPGVRSPLAGREPGDSTSTSPRPGPRSTSPRRGGF